MSIKTNRDFYLAISTLAEQHANSDLGLEQYLLTLLVHSQPFSKSQSLSLDETIAIFTAGFLETPATFESQWRDQYDQLPAEADSYLGWRATLIQQIVDLREMGEDGTLDDEHRYFGVTSPRQSMWYNFDPCAYLECAAAGAVGGWAAGDKSNRMQVPGQVAVMRDGSMTIEEPSEADPIFTISSLSWGQLKDFLECGRLYE
jgi:hypothetical protein